MTRTLERLACARGFRLPVVRGPADLETGRRYVLRRGTRDQAFYRGRRVMVTGGLGFIGSNLAHRLVTLGADVLLVDSLIPEYGGNLFNIAGIEDRVRVNIADVRQSTECTVLHGDGRTLEPINPVVSADMDRSTRERWGWILEGGAQPNG